MGLACTRMNLLISVLWMCCGCETAATLCSFRVLWDWGGFVAGHAAYWGHEVGTRFHITLSLRMYRCHCHYRPRSLKELRGLSLVTFNNLSCQEGLESCSDKGAKLALTNLTGSLDCDGQKINLITFQVLPTLATLSTGYFADGYVR